MVRGSEGSSTNAPAGLSDEAQSDLLRDYVPRMVIDWLALEPDVQSRVVEGTCVFADISGFTALTERLAVRDKAGAEEMGDLLNDIFNPLLTAAYDYGANLLKWGGDAVLLLFEGDDHAARAARASWILQRTIERIGRLQTSRGVVRLRMSIGIHTDAFEFMLVGDGHRELIVTGPAATTTARMEELASAGQVVMSKATASRLPPGCTEPAGSRAHLLISTPDIGLAPNRSVKRRDVDLGVVFCPPLRDHLRSSTVDHEHRHVTVGFIEFSGADAIRREYGLPGLTDDVAMLMTAVQEAADDQGITVLSTDICKDGGKIILVGGAPNATGDDETHLLNAVRRIIRPGGRLGLRAGVTRGRVFAGDYGTSYRRVYSITGDIVNLAARLMTQAAPGQIVAMPDVVAHCKTPFATDAMEPFRVKGKNEPIDALIVGDLIRSTPPPNHTRLPLIGRDAELALLVAGGRAAAAGSGRVIDLVGPPGMGKSHLAEKLVSACDLRPFWIDGDVYGQMTPYLPMQRLLRRTLSISDDADRDSLASLLTAVVDDTAPDLRPWLPLVGIVAGVTIESTPEVDVLDPEARNGRLRQATSDLLGRLLTVPTVFVLNDLHYMDDATIALIRQLCIDAADRPWLMITNRRPGSPTVVDGLDHASRIDLGPLGDEDAARILGEVVLSEPLPPHRARQLIERAGGNPLFLQALIAAVSAGEDIEALPDSIEGVIAAHIDRLAPPQRRWLRSASILGMTLDPGLLADLLDPEERIDVTAPEIAEFIRPDSSGQLQFAHHLIQLTAYEGLPYRQRRTLHARAANALERRAGDRINQFAALLSLHCLRGERYDAAWQYARTAGRLAWERYALVEAAECYERALEAATGVRLLPDPEVADACERLADIYLNLGEMNGADRALAQARRRSTGDAVRLARLRLKTARHRQHLGAHTDALRWIARGRTLLAADKGRESLQVLAELAEASALIRYDQGSYATAMTWATTALDESRACGDRATEASCLSVLAVLKSLLGLPWDELMARDALDTYDRSGDLRGRAVAANRIGMCAYFSGRWDEALGFYAESEHAYRRIGHEPGAATAAANQAEVLVQQGRPAEAITQLDPCFAVWRAARATSYLAFGLTLHGRSRLALDDIDLAENHLTEAATLCRQMGEVDEALTAEALLAECRFRSGEPEAALRMADETLAHAGRTTPTAEPLLHRIRGEALFRLDRDTEGDVALRLSLDCAKAVDAPYEVEATLRTLLSFDCGRDDVETGMWRGERSTLADKLGIVTASE